MALDNCKQTSYSLALKDFLARSSGNISRFIINIIVRLIIIIIIIIILIIIIVIIIITKIIIFFIMFEQSSYFIHCVHDSPTSFILSFDPSFDLSFLNSIKEIDASSHFQPHTATTMHHYNHTRLQPHNHTPLQPHATSNHTPLQLHPIASNIKIIIFDIL